MYERGGGVLIAISKHLDSSFIDITNTSLEQLYVKIHVRSATINVGGIYLPPSSPTSIYEQCIKTLCELQTRNPNCEFFVAGDFNLPKITWTTNDQGSIFHPQPSATSSISTIEYLNLYQINTIANCYNQYLDIIFSSFRDNTLENAIEPIVPIDLYHPALLVYLYLNASCNYKQTTRVIYSYKIADYSIINTKLNLVDWKQLFCDIDIYLYVDLFYHVLYSIIDDNVPFKKLRDSFPPCFNSKLKHLLIQKKVAHLNCKTTRTASNYDIFSKMRTRCQKLNNILYDKYIENTENSIKTNIKNFWNYVNSLKKDNKVPNTIKPKSITATNLEDKVQLFAQHFQTTFTNSTDDITPSTPIDIIHINSLKLTLSEIFDGISKLKLDTGPGLDAIPNFFLKNCQNIIASPLFILFNKSFFEGKLPNR